MLYIPQIPRYASQLTYVGHEGGFVQKRCVCVLFALAVLIVTVGMVLPLSGKDAKLKAEDVISRHLDSIGTSEARVAAKTRAAEGKVEWKEVVGGSSGLQGSAGFVCDNRRLKVTMKFPGSPNYPGEQWAFDGNNVMVAQTSPGSRSKIGNFLYTYKEIMREGLLGGSMCVSWPLNDLPGRQAKLKYDGIKKIDGHGLHQLTYEPRKGGSGLEIRLYFEPETFHHVKTIYLMNIGEGVGADVGRHGDEVREVLEETFGEFQTVDGLTLPTTWSLRYERQPIQGSVVQWNLKMEHIQNNVQL